MNSDDDLIKDIFRNYVEYGATLPRCHVLNNRIDLTTEKLMKRLNNENKKDLEKLCQYYEEKHLTETAETFVRGFAFATKLLSEAYGYKL